MRPAGMHRELCDGVRPAADDDSGVVRRQPDVLVNAAGVGAAQLVPARQRFGKCDRRLSAWARVAKPWIWALPPVIWPATAG
jgi:hypothetical protein